MEEYSQHPTPAQQEAQAILSHLLTKLQDPASKYHTRYAKWTTRHPKLEEFCFRCVRPSVWTFLSAAPTWPALKAIGGDIKFPGRAIYFDGVLGLDKRPRVYIGQSTNTRLRIGQHFNFRYRRDNPSLHYHALQHSSYNVFGVLCALPSPGMGNHTLPGMDCPDLLLNVLEMWMCLVFRSLPDETLGEWLPNGVKIEGGFGGLNIAAPVDHGEKEREWVDLSDSDDPLVREYLAAGDSVEKKSKEVGYQERRRRVGDGELLVHVTPGALLVLGATLFVGVWMLNRSARARPRWR